MSQHALAQDLAQDLSFASPLQPEDIATPEAERIGAGLVVVVLAALGFVGTLAYAWQNAICLRNGYAKIALTREIDDLHARIALLNYQINLAESSPRVEQVADRLSLPAPIPSTRSITSCSPRLTAGPRKGRRGLCGNDERLVGSSGQPRHGSGG